MTSDPQAYARWSPAFAQVIDPALYTMRWLDDLIASGMAQFLATARAAIVFELRHYPTGAKDIHGLIAAGDLADVTGVLIPQAEDIGRHLGCVGAIVESREAWGRLLKGRGYQPYQTSVRKVLA